MATNVSESHLLFLDSRDGIRSNSNSEVEWNLNNAISANLEQYRLTISNVEIPNLVYPVNRFSNKIYFRENGGAIVTATLTNNNYDGNTLATELGTQMTAVTGIAETYTGTYDVYTKKITIVASGGASMTFETGLNDVSEIIGFTQYGITTIGTIIGESPVRIDGTRYVDVITSLNTGNYSSSKVSTILFRVPMLSSFGNVNFLQNSTNDWIFVSSNSMNNFTIRLRDDRGNGYELPANGHYSITMKLEPNY